MIEIIRLILREIISILVLGLGVYAAVFGEYQLAMVCFLFLIWAEIKVKEEQKIKVKEEQNG